ncbi:MAG: metallophosphoesterase family protein [Phycisphaerales bacterium]|nr:metallophosphoesterase family protein [Phycisphaerales bacterium]MCB9862680.1 metallophosphoesterase family protein [Phycisphaerales bacterium]
MRLLLFSDLHCDKRRARALVAKSSDADVVIGAGDFATVHYGLETTIELLSAIAKPAILVPGNNETLDELRNACSVWPSAIVLHGNGTSIDGVEFFGIGGGIPVTPFGDWSFDFTEAQAEEFLVGLEPQSVLVSHSPPKGLLDVTSNGRSVGSAAVLAAIERTTPRLVVCGHIHDSAGQRVEHGETVVVNAGPEGVFHELE